MILLLSQQKSSDFMKNIVTCDCKSDVCNCTTLPLKFYCSRNTNLQGANDIFSVYYVKHSYNSPESLIVLLILLKKATFINSFYSIFSIFHYRCFHTEKKYLIIFKGNKLKNFSNKTSTNWEKNMSI